MYNIGSSPSVRNVLFSANGGTNGSRPSSEGGGMCNENHSSPSLIHVTFTANQVYEDGGGMYNNEYSSPSLVDVTFFANTASLYGGGLANQNSSPGLVNVNFIANQATNYGGGIYNYFSNPSLVNVTMVANRSNYDGGAIYNYGNGGNPSVYNSLLWGNEAMANPQIYNDPDNAIVLSFSDVQGGCPENSICDHLINADPLFVHLPSPGADGAWYTVDDDLGDLRLQLGSPAIDAGSNALLPADVLDLDHDGDTSEALPYDMGGLPRLTGSAVDLGAYETYWLCLPLISTP
jgi:hypothetical protein